MATVSVTPDTNLSSRKSLSFNAEELLAHIVMAGVADIPIKSATTSPQRQRRSTVFEMMVAGEASVRLFQAASTA